MSNKNAGKKATTRQRKVVTIRTIIASAIALTMVLLPAVSAQSGPPEQPDPNDYAARCHHTIIPDCESTLWYVDMHLWAVHFAVYCIQYPSQCSMGLEGPL